MASTYTRKDSPFIWIRYKDSAGKWKSSNTGYRQDNIGDRKQAEILAKRKSLEEMEDKPIRVSHKWEDWVLPWINSRWGNRTNRTPKMYANYFWNWLRYFGENEISQPAALRREHVIGYLSWREKRGGHRNTAIHEIKFLGMLMDEAVTRGYATANPARKLHLEKTPPPEKNPWSDFEIERVDQALRERYEYGWMHVTFLMGLHQAARLRQAEIPLSRIDFNRRIIDYPADAVKGGKGKGSKGYAQPINPDFFPILQEIVRHRQSLGKAMLCEIPGERETPASVQWRRFLDEVGLRHLVHHGLRCTFITRAALAGIPEALTRRFVNHASQQIHEIYQKVTATDLLPMLDAFSLYRHNQSVKPPVTSSQLQPLPEIGAKP